MDSMRFKIRLQSWTAAVVIAFLMLHLVSIATISLGLLQPLRVLEASWLVALLSLPLVWSGGYKITKAFSLLAEDAARIRNLDFSGTTPSSSLFVEVDVLNRLQSEMKESLRQQTFTLRETQVKLSSLVQNGLLLSSENDRTRLLTHILMEGKRICNADAATMYLKTENDSLRFSLRTKGDALPSVEIALHDANGKPNEAHVSTYVALHNQSVLIDDVYQETRFDLSGTRHFDQASGYRTVSMLTVPLAPRDGEVIGVLQFMNALDFNTGEVIPFPAQVVSFVEALASQSAIALDNRNLIDSQEALIDSMIRIIAGAIDAKSPYTGSHCERVPELAIMLAEEACKVTKGPLAAFDFKSSDEWREFRIGAWLHDCGKVTTPEHIVDKATKLEIVNNRIHEVRTRFEVLYRDAQISCLKAQLDGAAALVAEAQFAKRVQELQEEFAFIAASNIGGEELSQERVARINAIGQRTWLRHFDNRLGLSQEELGRMQGNPAPALPALERLLADKPEHIIASTSTAAQDPRFGFALEVPKHAFNYGEIYNLSVSRGTLTFEERFKVNEHIVQTIVMLEQLPFPPNLRRVPEYAGTHHETLCGTGFPRRLGKEQLSIPARIMAIADIFEALTAADRPYKRAKTLSESLQIMANLKRKGRIDGDLFDLFLRAGLHLRYGANYLLPEQMDTVVIEDFIDPPNADCAA